MISKTIFYHGFISFNYILKNMSLHENLQFAFIGYILSKSEVYNFYDDLSTISSAAHAIVKVTLRRIVHSKETGHIFFQWAGKEGRIEVLEKNGKSGIR